ncbi:hypothetical protein NH514_14450 [Pseudoalteromonas sp. ACER1]|uniref:hypothetical protein n=1 Tax=unclassified Pseudoalteromonas TaxID=194690 RepID=UPI001F17B73B|nr:MULTISPECIES: hypothetical protein [unclassified Pseudoalteromonas]MCF2848446.1 hypothetical protein [Pseudoalteromonas sp. PAST1]MCO7211932.1 hypothetical protein [Pseudoalteromonas sp. ACER1]
MDKGNIPKITTAFKTVDNKELKSTGFWLNQLFLVFSTIFGVYLAAQSGLEQALKFDSFSKMEDNYYLRTSLYDEVKDNADHLKKFANLLAKSPPKSELEYNKPTIEKYIWQTMQYSPTTLETPSEFLTEIRRFYSKSQFIIDAAISRKMSAKHASKQLNEAVDIINNKTLPNLKSSALKLQSELSKNGIQISSLKESEQR